MKKKIFFIILIIFLSMSVLFLLNSNNIIWNINKDKKYVITNREEIKFNNLDKSSFFSKGIITYNDQKIIYKDYNNNNIWENQSRVFIESIYIEDGYIYKCLKDSMEIINKNNQSFIVPNITGKIINVSRETNYTIIITKDSGDKNYLYLLNENNEVVVDSKKYNNIITGVSVNEKSKSYITNTLEIENNIIVNTINYNLIDNLDIWSKVIENEIILNIKYVNNNILLIGTENIYFYNLEGNLLWKNCNYNKLKGYQIKSEEDKFYILFEKDEKLEIVCYNFGGKVKEIYKIPINIDNFRIYNNKRYIFNKNIIGIFSIDGVDILYEEQNDEIIDFHVEYNNIYILFKDKLIKLDIK